MCIYDQPACTFLLLYGRYNPCLTIQVLHCTINLLTLAPAAKVTVQDYCKLTNTSLKQVVMFPVLWTALLSTRQQLIAHSRQWLHQAAELLEGGDIW